VAAFDYPPTAEELLRKDISDPPMIIGRGLIPANGYSMLAAYTKVGKSTLAIQMCLSIVSGTDFLGFQVEDTVKILYCYLENTEASISKLIRQQTEHWGAEVANIDQLHLLDARGLDLQSQSSTNKLRATIEAVGPKLVAIDPISMAVYRDVNHIATIREFVRVLQDLSEESGVAWLLVHHYGKPTMQKRQPIQAMLGSSGFGNFTETFIGLERYSDHRSPDYRRVSFNLRHAATPADMCIFLNPTTRLFELVENPNEIPPISVDRVVDIIRDHDQPISYTLLTEMVKHNLGLHERSAKSLIAAARDCGKIVKEEGRYGKYFLF
jgi:KaiC/GvpD/RAD55 family RecA-like ATPase